MAAPSTCWFLPDRHSKHLSLVATYYVATGGFLFPQYTTILGMLLPLFAGYLSVIIKFFTSHKYSPSSDVHSPTMALPFIVLSFFFPTLFGVFLAGCIILAAKNMVFRDFDDVKIAVGLGESAFGIYIGQFIFSLFDSTGRTTLTNSAAKPRQTKR
jgi:hypothetical protein